MELSYNEQVVISNLRLTKNPIDFINQVINIDKGLDIKQYISIPKNKQHRQQHFQVYINKTCDLCHRREVNVIHCSYTGQYCRQCIDYFIAIIND